MAGKKNQQSGSEAPSQAEAKPQQSSGIDWANLPKGERHKIYHSLRQEAIKRALEDARVRPIYEEHLAACKREIGYPEDAPQRSSGNRFAALKAKIGG